MLTAIPKKIFETDIATRRFAHYLYKILLKKLLSLSKFRKLVTFSGALSLINCIKAYAILGVPPLLFIDREVV